jgi:hypothetical protein
MMGCTKGIEMFNTYYGILEMYKITGEKKYLTAAQNYWRNLQDKYKITNPLVILLRFSYIPVGFTHLHNCPVCERTG